MNKSNFTREAFQKYFESEPEAIDWALKALYSRQASEEKDTASNIHKNARGFCLCDVKKFTQLAKIAITQPLSVEQRAYLLAYTTQGVGRLSKYVRQLNQLLEEPSLGTSPPNITKL